MRVKIDGHIYDTATSKEIASKSGGPDDNGWEEVMTLYRTRRGMYFVHCRSEIWGTRHRHEEICPKTREEAAALQGVNKQLY